MATGRPASGCCGLLPRRDRPTDQGARLLGEPGQDRGEVDGELAEQIERHARHVLQLARGLGAGLGKLPGLLGIDVGIGPVGGQHDVASPRAKSQAS